MRNLSVPFPSWEAHFSPGCQDLALCVCVSCYANQRQQEPGWKRPNAYHEADLQMKPGAYCCDNRTADPAALGEAEVDDRPTAMWGLAA